MKIKCTIIPVTLALLMLPGCESTPDYSSASMSGYGASSQYPSSSASTIQPPSVPGRISVNELCPERVNTTVGDMRDGSDIDCVRDVGPVIGYEVVRVTKDAEAITKIPLYR